MENQFDHEKMMFQEMAGIMEQAHTNVVQRIHPDRQVNLHIQSIPQNVRLFILGTCPYVSNLST